MHLIQAGVNLIYIRDLLGHVDVSTTEIYARADAETKRKAIENAYEPLTPDALPDWTADPSLIMGSTSLGRQPQPATLAADNSISQQPPIPAKTVRAGRITSAVHQMPVMRNSAYRHTFATLMIAAGVNPKALRRSWDTHRSRSPSTDMATCSPAPKNRPHSCSMPIWRRPMSERVEAEIEAVWENCGKKHRRIQRSGPALERLPAVDLDHALNPAMPA